MIALFAFEALRFHRLKNQVLVQLMFLGTFVVHALFQVFPPGRPDLNGIVNQMMRVASGQAQYTSLAPFVNPSLIIFMVGLIVLNLFNVLVSLIYASALTRELDGLRATQGAQEMIGKIPQLLGMVALLVVPALLSALFMWIPLVILITFLAFTPLFMSTKRLKLSASMSESIRMTRGVKLPLVLSFLLLTLMMNLPRNIASALVPNTLVAQALIQAFFAALIALMQGRLLGLYFVYFVNRFPMGNAGIYKPGDPRILFAEIGRSSDPEVASDEDEDDAEVDDTRLPGDHWLPGPDADDDDDDTEDSSFPRFPWQR